MIETAARRRDRPAARTRWRDRRGRRSGCHALRRRRWRRRERRPSLRTRAGTRATCIATPNNGRFKQTLQAVKSRKTSQLDRRRHSPVGGDAGEVEDEVVVDELVGAVDEAALLGVGADCRRARDGLAEVRVDGRARRRLDALQLPRRRDVEPLREDNAGV